ncbi:hypothetical protein GA0061099_101435 [Bradyrhizobium yuanmingense]|uniref:Uncharacterized protein n=1 Tax=Bradyrhizobium yuanmingense TaxID=108015 RepID=A0A1C3XFH0_9BRAD|nr:hypothetical protein IQ15_06839 [Bradyrhizobium yuanmingense]SCB51020.1 hypothetical protein GA0061099_101435 [Bradyrhizobium yuanmingense]
MEHDFVQSVTGNQRRDPGHENKILGDCIFYSLQTTAEFIQASGGRSPMSEFSFGKQLSSSETRAAPA